MSRAPLHPLPDPPCSEEADESLEKKALDAVVTELGSGNPVLGSCLLLPTERLGVWEGVGHLSRLQKPGLRVCPSGSAPWSCQEQGRLLRGLSSLPLPQGFLFSYLRDSSSLCVGFALRVSELGELLLL